MIDEIIKRERKRFNLAVERAREVVIKNYFSEHTTVSAKQFEDFNSNLVQLEHVLLLVADKVFDYLPTLFEKKRGRSVWDIYLNGIRYLARRIQSGTLFSYLSFVPNLEDLMAKINSYLLDNVLSGVSDVYNLMIEIEKYNHWYAEAKEICSPYETSDNKFERLCRIYAILKAWTREDEFQACQDKLSKGLDRSFQIIVEGPIKLYLVIGKDNFFFLLRFLTAETAINILERREELEDLRNLHDFIYDQVENSNKTFRNLLSKALELYSKDLIKEFRDMRGEFPNDELKRRFIQRFESKEIFRN
jgi:hypothetical protein